MAVAFRSIISIAYSARTNSVIGQPAGLVNGDIMLATVFVYNDGAARTVTAPAGWTQIGTFTNVADSGSGTGRTYTFWKRAASESGSYTFTHASGSSQAIIEAYSGCIASGNPIDVSGTATGNSSTTTGPSITTTGTDRMLVWRSHDWEGLGALTAPAGMTERFDGLLYSATQLLTSSGATGTRTQTNGNFNSGYSCWGVWMIALIPEPAPTVNPLTLTVGGTGTVSASKSTGKSATIAGTGTVSVLKGASNILTLGGTVAVSISKRAGKIASMSASATTLLASARAYLLSLSVAGTGAVTTAKSTGKRVNIAATGAVSARKAITRTLGIAATGAVSAAKSVARSISIQAAGSVSILKSIAKAISVSATGDVSSDEQFLPPQTVFDPPDFVAAAAMATTTASSSVAPAIPSSSTGDVEFLQAICIGSTTAFSVTKSGTDDWNLIFDAAYGGNRYALWWKRKESGETAPTVTNSGRTSTNLLIANIVAYTDALDIDIPIGLTNSVQGTSAALAGPEIHTSGRNSLAITFTMRAGASTASVPDALWDEDLDDGSASGGAARMYVDSQDVEYPSIVPGVLRDGTGNFFSFGVELLGKSLPIDAIDQPHIGHMWVRDFESIVGNPASEETLVDACLDAGISDIYCATDAAFVAANQTAISDFIEDCTLNGIKVWGLDGDRRYFADADGSDDLLDNIQAVIDYNTAVVDAGKKFVGFHIDCDPTDQGGYLAFHNGIASSALSSTPGSGEWQDTEVLDREYLMRDWCDLHEDCSALCSTNGLKLASALPVWFDDYEGEPVICTFDGETQNVYLHLKDLCDHISLKSYNTDPRAVIDLVRYEILNCGEATIGVSVETNAGVGDGISYADTAGKDDTTSVFLDLDTLHNRFYQHPGYSAFHINDWIGWSELAGISNVTSVVINIASGAAVSIRKGVARSLAVAANGNISATKRAGKPIAINSTATQAAARGVQKLMSTIVDIDVLLRRAANKTVAINATAAQTTTKRTAKSILISATGTVSAAARQAFVKIIGIGATGAVSLGRAVAKRISIASNASVFVGFGQYISVIIDMSVSGAVSLGRRTSKVVAIPVTATVSARKAVSRTIAISASATASVRKGFTKTFDLAVNAVSTIASGQAYTRVVNIAATGAVSVAKRVGKVTSIGGTAQVAISKRMGKLVQIVANGSIITRKAISRTISVPASALVVARKSVSKAFSTGAVGTVSASASRIYYQVSNMAASASVSIAKAIDKNIEIAQSATVSVGKAISRTLNIASGAIARIGKAIEKMIPVSAVVELENDASNPFQPEPTPVYRTVYVLDAPRTVYVPETVRSQAVEVN